MDLKALSRRVASVRLSSIHCNPARMFFYIPFPDVLNKKYSEIGRSILGDVSRMNDHLTLLYLKDQDESVIRTLIPKIAEELRALCNDHRSIKAKLQGWAYFDGATGDDDQPSTALVGLVDAPGLEDLHVDVKRLCKSHGIDVSQNHGFNCHTTFGYLPHGHRLTDLPLIDSEFTIDQFCLANDRVYEFPFNK